MPEAPVESGWALTRDAQRRAVAADGNAGLAVTIDIGNRDDVHPTNKQEVGRRLARAARHVVFGDEIVAVRRAARVGATRSGGDVRGAVRRQRRQARGLRLARSVRLRVVRRRDAGSCRYVRAQLSGEAEVTLEARRGGRGRRACASAGRDSPLCNLYDAAGLPVGPFEIEIK